jgi:hypothetical protein
MTRVRRRAEQQPDTVLPVLRLLAGEPRAELATDPEPGAASEPAIAEVAREINAARAARDRARFVAGSLTATEVAELLGVTSRQAVAQRRARGRLLGAPVGGTVRYPRWQFGRRGLAPDLYRLLGLLPRDARTADAIMRAPHAELDGSSLADAFRAGDWETLEAWLRDVVDPDE